MLDLEERPKEGAIKLKTRVSVTGPWEIAAEYRHMPRERREEILAEAEGHLERAPEHLMRPVIEGWKRRLGLN